MRIILCNDGSKNHMVNFHERYEDNDFGMNSMGQMSNIFQDQRDRNIETIISMTTFIQSSISASKTISIS